MKQLCYAIVVCFFAALVPCHAARAQTSVTSQFFGAGVSGCNPAKALCSTWEIWWPNSTSGSSPDITFGAAGKMVNGGDWTMIEPSDYNLTWVTDSGPLGGHWHYTSPDWSSLDAYVGAANASGVDVTETFWHVPSWDVCFFYPLEGYYFGGDPSHNGASIPCSALSVPTPYDTPYDSSSCTSANPTYNLYWCPSTGFNPDFGELDHFAKQLVDHYYGFSTLNHVAIKYYEFTNEPDSPASWPTIADSICVGCVAPDWPDLILWGNSLETTITNEYIAKGASDSPTYVGPTISTTGDDAFNAAMCGDATGCEPGLTSNPGFLNTYVSGIGYGSSLITVGAFHLYPANETTHSGGASSPPDDGYGDTPACKNRSTYYMAHNLGYTTLECTGQNLITDLTDRMTTFHTWAPGVSTIFMDEGSWEYGDNFSSFSPAGPTVQFDSETRAYIARSTIIMAATAYPYTGGSLNINRQYWWSWSGGLGVASDWGALCDTGATDNGHLPSAPPCATEGGPSIPYDQYGGYAYGQVYNWLQNHTIGSCRTNSSSTNCVDAPNALWTYQITDTSSNNTYAVWVFDDGGSVTCNVTGTPTTGCPSFSGYTHYQDLKSSTQHSLSSTIIFTREPVLLVP